MKGIWTAIKYKNEVVDPGLPESSPSKRRPVIYIWVRDTEGKRHRIKIEGFRPYFYVPTWLNSKTHELLSQEEIEEIEEVSFNYKGSVWKLLKVYTYLPGHVGRLRRLISSTHGQGVVKEGDVLFELRYLIDNGIRASVECVGRTKIVPIEEELNIPLRIVYLDLEIWSDRQIKERMRKDEYIKCITAYDSYEQIYYTWFVGEENLKSNEDNWKVVKCPSVKELLINFFNYIKERDPDVITGYNVDFDLIVLRFESYRQGLQKYFDYLSALHDLGYSVGRPVTKKHRIRGVDWKRRGIILDGREVIDILDLIRMISYTQLEEYNLDFVAKKFLGKDEGKLTWNGKKIGPRIKEVWAKDPLLVLKYNKHDTELCVLLDKKRKLIEFLDELRKTVGVRLGDAFSQQRMIDTEALRRSKVPLPSKFERKSKESYTGALVIEPVRGRHNWVVALDYSSLYPSIIRTFNVDTESYIEDARLLKGRDAFFLKSGGKKWIFLKSPRGLIPQMLDDFIKRRMEVKERMKREKDRLRLEVLDTKQNSYKILANSCYGMYGYRSRKYSPTVAEAVTLIGQEVIKFTKQLLEERGYLVVYGDTDSVLFVSKSNNYSDALEEGKRMRKIILEELPKFLSGFGLTEHDRNYFDIKVERVYKVLYVSRKKRYCGLISSRKGEEKLEIKGLDIRRSDSSELAKELQKFLLESLLRGKEKEVILNHISEKLNQIETYDLGKIGVPSAISKELKAYKNNAIQKRAAMNSNYYLSTKFGYGDKPKRVYIIPPEEIGDPFLDVIAFDEETKIPKYIKVDYQKMIDKTIRPKIVKFLEELEISWEEIEGRLNPELVIKKRRKRKKPVVTLDKFMG